MWNLRIFGSFMIPSLGPNTPRLQASMCHPVRIKAQGPARWPYLLLDSKYPPKNQLWNCDLVWNESPVSNQRARKVVWGQEGKRKWTWKYISYSQLSLGPALSHSENQRWAHRGRLDTRQSNRDNGQGSRSKGHLFPQKCPFTNKSTKVQRKLFSMFC